MRLQRVPIKQFLKLFAENMFDILWGCGGGGGAGKENLLVLSYIES